jgi:mono/diheme cytochrome c family protein
MANGQKLKGRDITAEALLERSDERLVTTIREGAMFGLRMPAFKGTLREEDIQALVRNVLRKARRGEPITGGSADSARGPSTSASTNR